MDLNALQMRDVVLVAYVCTGICHLPFIKLHFDVFSTMIVDCTGENTAVLQTSRKSQHKNAFVVGNVHHYFLCIFRLFTCIDERQLALFGLL